MIYIFVGLILNEEVLTCASWHTTYFAGCSKHRYIHAPSS